jgi:hypothetical protein
MAAQGQVVGYETAINAASGKLPEKMATLANWIAAWVDACAEYRGSAALYEQLRRLSDAELQKRGLTRDTLARYAFKLRD